MKTKKAGKRTAKGCTVILATIQFDDDDAVFVCENTDESVERALYGYVKDNWAVADIDDPLPKDRQEAIQQYLSLTNATLRVVGGLKVL